MRKCDIEDLLLFAFPSPQGYFATLLSSLPPATPLSSSKLAAILHIASQAGAMCVEREGAMESVPMLKEVKERMEQTGRWKSEDSWASLL